MDVELVSLGVGALLAAGIAASLLAGRLRLPGLVLVLVLGMVIGSDGLELINFGSQTSDYDAAQAAAIMALALILYEGGLSSGWAEIKPVIRVSVLLATVGTLITAGLTGIAALFLFTDLSTLEALMLGSTVAATDAAAVFAVLRGSTLRRRIARTLEGESGVNDPVAVLLVLGCIHAIQHADYGITDALLLAVEELAIGAVIGLAVGWLGMIVLRQVTLPSAGLYPVASVALAAIAYGGAATIHGSGFLAVFLAGLVIGSASSPARRTIITFHEGLAWVAQLGLFLLLGLLVNPRELIDIIPEGAAIAVVTAVIARPLAALIVAVRVHVAGAPDPRLGGAARRDPDRVRHLPRHRGDRARPHDLPGRVLRRAALHRAAGADDRADRALARRHLRRGGDPRPAGRAGDPQPPGRGDDAVPGPRGRRRRGSPGARARAPARGAAERDRPWRARDPAPRLDRHPGGRPAPRARPPGDGDGVPRADAALAHRPGRPARAPAPAAAAAARR